jgi:drug/metabolite transporter (DMT)-like permease
MKKIFSFGPVFVIIAALLWSLDGILRVTLYSMPVSVIVFYEHLIGLILILFLGYRYLGDLKQMTRREWLAIAIVALFSGALGTMFYTRALQLINYTQYSVVVLLQQQLQPIWTFAMASILLKEKLSRSFISWAVVALVAAYFITFPQLRVNLTTGAGTSAAAMFAILAGLMWGASTAVSKLVLAKVTFLGGTALRFLFTPVFALMFVIGQNQTPALFQLTPDQWQTLLLISLSTGMVAVAIYYYGLKKTPARVATLCELVWPASAVVIDYVYFDKSLTLTQILGILVLGFAIVNITKNIPDQSNIPGNTFN